ncbi:hypothetical protein Aeqsu_0201 [Aequorivita sublithincola DSM 14238]|uniref:RiboL-PSP-HEPN domain-containing protein n=1 Tax=Aequorivita sublithincola (strain DSM 14238 / LMG 21431 / ACAM 643 / 9-3) TaxID=746697 RepID=I3YRV7_AEQSU|nr:hypothetical protein [Aequorivita sublithincola]AFL79725.1 hypothetical protein Aeqsu_0201 [Aequorivita sublithincola DSM 14238]
MNTLQKIEDRFDEHLRTVDELISFDKIILDLCINHIENLNERLKSGPFEINNPLYLAEGTLQTMKTVRENNSLRIKYLSMFNSCLVLQVSYFTSIVDDIFKHTIYRLNSHNQRPDLDIKLIKQNNDVNFQNMNSIMKTYKKYLNIEIKKDSICNTIILAQCSRHAIVHSLGFADQKFINQINPARPRDIKLQIEPNEKIQYSSSELQFVKYAMQEFVSKLCESIYEKHNVK